MQNLVSFFRATSSRINSCMAELSVDSSCPGSMPWQCSLTNNQSGLPFTEIAARSLPKITGQPAAQVGELLFRAYTTAARANSFPELRTRSLSNALHRWFRSGATGAPEYTARPRCTDAHSLARACAFQDRWVSFDKSGGKTSDGSLSLAIANNTEV